jgi:gamma-glutamyl-gamma-aminobutyrate hydrolase PuuD
MSKKNAVMIVGGTHQYKSMFTRMGWDIVDNIELADVVQFCGGADVTPSLYSCEAHPRTWNNKDQDAKEAILYAECKALHIPMVGICRGGQFLNVMNGGTMWQDVDNHTDSHYLTDVDTGEKVMVTSTHHQMMIPHMSGKVLAIAQEAERKETMVNGGVRLCQKKVDDVEVVWYPDSMSLCFQPHPEFSEGSCNDYYFQLIGQYI